MLTHKLHGSPNSPTASSTPTIVERGASLSTRRMAPHQPDDNATSDPINLSAVSSPRVQYLEKDESKIRRFNFSLLASNYISRAYSYCIWPAPCLVLCLIIVFISLISLAFHSRKFVCISQFDPKARVALFGLDGIESDFGALGTPWCRSKNGKSVEWTTKDLLKGLEEFVPIYQTRPIKHNVHGMGFDHSFGLWFIARWINPELVIESGVFKGHSTWVLRQALPDKPIISLSPRHPRKYLKKGPAYVDENCTYFAGNDFIDFGSVKWKQVLLEHGVADSTQVLVFFDDHQSELKRMKQALNSGFKHLVFEDNYDTGTGDHYSLRQICDQFYIRGGGHSCFKDGDEARMRSKREMFWEKAVDIDELCGEKEEWWGVRGYARDNFSHSNEKMTYHDHFMNSRYVESVLDVYWEVPPVAGPSLTHQTRYDPARSTPPIVADGRFGLFQRMGLGTLDSSVFNGYTQMVYVQVSL